MDRVNLKITGFLQLDYCFVPSDMACRYKKTNTLSLPPDPQCINSPASHEHTCPSWPAAMATHVNFSQAACSQIFSFHPPLSFDVNPLLQQSKTQWCTDTHTHTHTHTHNSVLPCL